ncbi:triose-phosphate isomerase [Pacificimonas sp. WHA3]|uniref:Triosephosphate isomerase n=1 Tax=Pacificimonas pallii TaxID=2827236 RepID=A0ABS6SDP5_9SPHN|nr:triose-phosphate isomerase [Pacificimonas pallii]MBV7256529.1 triose-phosphate isomerase [Pacificimonas pallii]
MAKNMLIAGNWKMNGTHADLAGLGAFAGLADRARDGVSVALAVPHTLVFSAAQLSADTSLSIGGEDCHHKESGAHTGCVSAAMLRDAGASFTILGHSERRADQGESDADVHAKAEAALAAGLDIIICVGETESERDAGTAQSVVGTQLAGSVPDCDTARLTIAYEPVWAIGTGRTPTPDDVAAMHDHIRAALVSRFGEAGESVLILYGGSVKAANAEELLHVSNVGGALVGGASLTVADFAPIVEAA